ncbi:MAG: 5-formyltetrahydrofolate cyclo-ligase [Actinomycetota bacterium]|nr:5-formyltetrahydrofolate cyclo-ligase [Actinomycetota bacterium]
MDHDLTVDSVRGDVSRVRSGMLARRRALAPDVVACASAIVVERILGLPEVRDAQVVGAYMGVRGEVDPSLLRDEPGFEVAFPVAREGEALRFVVPSGPLREGPFGIPQPDSGREVQPCALDVVLVPLVAADSRGNRVGHGAGFYDRTFGDCRRSEGGGPVLVGICHAFQVVPELEPHPWDVSMDLLVTDAGLIRPGG